MTDDSLPFWRRKALSEMTEEEWESLCDGCGRCCLVKLEEEAPEGEPEPENPRIFFTDVGCRLLDTHSCRCRDYANRDALVPDCVRLTARVVQEIGWLPPTCAYRRLAEGKDLAWWHPLVSGDPETVHWAGISVRGRVRASEDKVAEEALEDHIVGWPLRVPKRARKPPREGGTAPPNDSLGARGRSRLPVADGRGVAGGPLAPPSAPGQKARPVPDKNRAQAMKLPGPDHPITIEPNPNHVRIIFNGRVVADTRRALTVKEASLAPVLYIPREDAETRYLERTSHTTHCPYKGDAAYYSLRVGDREAVNAVWSYEHPYPAMAALAGRLAFYPDRVEAIEQIPEETEGEAGAPGG